MPGYLDWFGVKQILWVCSEAMQFIYHNITSNVGLSIILYALFVQVFFLPFSIKKGFDRLKSAKLKKKRKEIRQEFMALSEEERADENVKNEYREKEKAIKKEKKSSKLGCLVIILRLFVVLATTPVIRYFDHFIGPAPEAYNFLGFDLSAGGPGYSLTPSLIFPIFTTLVLVIPGIISTVKTLKERDEIKKLKTKEELEEEARMLKEMGVKESKIPWGIIIQIGFGFLYFHSFSRLALTVSLFWGVYYVFGKIIGRLVDFVFAKANQQLLEKQGEERSSACCGDS